MNQQERIEYLILELQKDMPDYENIRMPGDPSKKWDLFRSLCNLREPKPAPSAEFLRVEGEFLREKNAENGLTDAAALAPTPLDDRICLWQGDITTLQVDAIVNAANSKMLGCFQPCHSCIDNIIHTKAGIELRIRMGEIMRAQGHDEETGQAKITPGYNLPAKHVLHTVGPICYGRIVTEENTMQLASCYRSCLDLAASNGLRSVAFCCISTGVFLFPKNRAANIAVATVREWLDAHPGSSVDRVIFNVFSNEDRLIYEAVLGK